MTCQHIACQHMSDGVNSRMDDILGQALAKAEITSAGPIKIQPRPVQAAHVTAPAPPPSGGPPRINHAQTPTQNTPTQQRHQSSPGPQQKLVTFSRPRNGPTTPNSQGQNIIIVRNGQQGKGPYKTSPKRP